MLYVVTVRITRHSMHVRIGGAARQLKNILFFSIHVTLCVLVITAT